MTHINVPTQHMWLQNNYSAFQFDIVFLKKSYLDGSLCREFSSSFGETAQYLVKIIITCNYIDHVYAILLHFIYKLTLFSYVNLSLDAHNNHQQEYELKHENANDDDKVSIMVMFENISRYDDEEDVISMFSALSTQRKKIKNKRQNKNE